jgi:hypothetical protein
MTIAGKFTKQPIEIQDYDIDFNEYLGFHNDIALSHTSFAESGVTIFSSNLIDGVVKVFIAGGTDGNTYKVSATITTQGGRVKQGDILVKVKEV